MWSKIKTNFLSLLAAFSMIVLISSGIIQGFRGSLQKNGFANYKNLIKTEEFQSSILLSLKLAVTTTFLVAIISLAIIYSLYKMKNHWTDRKMTLSKNILTVPVLFPYIVAAFCMGMLLTQSGILARIAYKIGFIKEMSEFPELVNDKKGIGIIIAYLWKTVPFMILMLYPILEKIKDKWYDLGKIYKASEFQFFRYLVFPMIKNAFMTGLFIVFAYSFSAFEIPYFLGRTYPKTLSVYSYLLYTKGPFEEKSIALAANFILTITVSLIGLLGYYFYTKLKQREVK